MDTKAGLDVLKAAKLGYFIKYHRTLKGQYTQLRGSSKRRGLEMTISFDEFCTLRSGLCRYCSLALPPTSSGLDRVHREIGYVKGNVVPCCKRCNIAKGYLEGLGFSLPRILDLLQEAILINKVRVPGSPQTITKA